MYAVNSVCVNSTMKEDTNTQETETQTTGLSINDLITLRRIVEIASERGAFRAPELTAVGQVYDRMNTWLQSVLPAEEESDGNETPDQGEVDD